MASPENDTCFINCQVDTPPPPPNKLKTESIPYSSDVESVPSMIVTKLRAVQKQYRNIVLDASANMILFLQ